MVQPTNEVNQQAEFVVHIHKLKRGSPTEGRHTEAPGMPTVRVAGSDPSHKLL
jgi:hypothetical protein